VLLAVAVAVLWLVTFEGGLLSEAIGQANSFLHELFHDGRHLIGVPCH
jgi:Probable cobalt transporter subunit (CbtB)